MLGKCEVLYNRAIAYIAMKIYDRAMTDLNVAKKAKYNNKHHVIIESLYETLKVRRHFHFLFTFLFL
jgi:hypothetical protein